MASKKKEQEEKELISALTGAIRLVADEPVALAKLEPFFSPKPARLDDHYDAKALQARVDCLVEALGGPPRLVVRRIGDPTKESADFYPQAALSEVVNMFHRTRRAICRAQMVLVGSRMIIADPKLLSIPEDSPICQDFLDVIDSAFWEHAESAYIRLASFWDRVGQLFDFAFFGIRQFERDGFTAVVDRIFSNFVPVHATFRDSASWNSLRSFQTSERTDGLKWLLRRRNIVVHSLFLRPLTEPEESSLFDSEFNHLEEKLRERLCPGTPAEEIERLNGHLTKIAELFPAIIELCEQAAKIKSDKHRR
jgi:hypothetical protein